MKIYTFFICLVAALGGLLFGFDTAVISGAIEFLIAPQVFDLDEIEKGITVGSILIGCMAGSLLAGKPSDIFGRKKVLMFAAFLFIISSLGCAVSNNLAIFLSFRITGGVGVGIASMLSPMYIAEVSPPGIRGKLVALNQFTIVLGILLAFFSNYLLRDFGGINNWRWMLGVMLIPASLFFALLFVIPESPRWLIQRNKSEEAFRILSKINSRAEAEKELKKIKESISSVVKVKYKELLSGPMRKLLMIGIFLAVFQQITGINVIIYYAPSIFLSVGLGTGSALLQTVIIGCVNLVFTIVAILFVDKIGRRPLLLTGVLGMAISLFILSSLFFMNYLSGYWTLILILSYCAFFDISLGPVVWVLISEIFPNRLRSMAISISVLFIWTSNFIVSSTFPYLLKNLNGGFTFLIYAVMCVACFVFIYLNIKETKGKSLEEIEMSFIIAKEDSHVN